jgi:tRNA-dihydrouridine synthase
VVAIPVIVNGDVRTADDVVRALAETQCAAVMVGRAAIDHPWIFREARARLAGTPIEQPTDAERRAVYRELLEASIAARGDRGGVHSTKRHVGVLGQSPSLRQRVVRARDLAEAYAAITA